MTRHPLNRVTANLMGRSIGHANLKSKTRIGFSLSIIDQRQSRDFDKKDRKIEGGNKESVRIFLNISLRQIQR